MTSIAIVRSLNKKLQRGYAVRSDWLSTAVAIKLDVVDQRASRLSGILSAELFTAILVVPRVGQQHSDEYA